jgi:hypothetical protein
MDSGYGGLSDSNITGFGDEMGTVAEQVTVLLIVHRIMPEFGYDWVSIYIRYIVFRLLPTVPEEMVLNGNLLRRVVYPILYTLFSDLMSGGS